VPLKHVHCTTNIPYIQDDKLCPTSNFYIDKWSLLLNTYIVKRLYYIQKRAYILFLSSTVYHFIWNTNIPIMLNEKATL
jgi:hypothetical protein